MAYMRNKACQKVPSGHNTHSSKRNPPVAEHSPSPTPPGGPISPEELHSNCVKALEFMKTMNLDLGTLIDSVFYGNPLSRASPGMKAAHASFVQTARFLQFLTHIYNPPRAPNGKGTQATSGKDTLTALSVALTHGILKSELATFSAGYQVDKHTLIQVETMEDITSERLGSDMKNLCPNLWETLTMLAGNEETVLAAEEEEEKAAGEAKETREAKGKEAQGKDAHARADGEEGVDKVTLDGYGASIKPHPHFGTIMCISSLAYRANRLKNKLQAVLSVYAHAKHTSKALHGLLHQAGILLSYPWTIGFVDVLSEAKHQQAIQVAENRIICISHDNIKLKALVRSQRGDHQSVSDNGTAITMYALPDSAKAFDNSSDWQPFFRTLRLLCIQGRAPHLCWSNLMIPARLKRVRKDYTFDVLDMLRMVPGMEQSEVLKSVTLKHIVGPQQLPHGKENQTEMHMLPTVNVDESTYSGNIQVVRLTLAYLRLLDTKEKRNRLALARKIPWGGDQMTSMFCNGAQFFLNEAENPIARLEPFIFMFCGFHCEMALAAGTFEKSRGTSSGAATFARDTIILSRTGLNANMNQKRPDFHTVDEFLLHELEARLRCTFLLEAGCSSEQELVAWVESHTPEEVLTLADNVYTNHASNAALANLTFNDSTDKLRPSTTLTNANLLRYYAYRHANKHGRINRIEDLLPELLAFFSGSGNSNYAKELYFFLQLITHECTSDLKSAILKHCLLVNMQGREDSFYPIDQRQEHNNTGIRNYGPKGANATWEQHRKIAPVIPYYMYNIQHVEGKIAGQRHSHIHKDPKRKADIQTLMRSHNASRIHTEVARRNIDPKDKTKDCMSAGTLALKETKLEEYAIQREVFFTGISDENVYSSDDDNNKAKLKARTTDMMDLAGSSMGNLAGDQELDERGIERE